METTASAALGALRSGFRPASGWARTGTIAGPEGVARDILHADVRFRGSLGAVEQGPEGFISYMRLIHAALSEYTCTIAEMIENGHRVAARLCFAGVHTGVFLGASPTGREISWDGAAFVATDRGGITEVWVLGDLDALKRRLAAATDGGGE